MLQMSRGPRAVQPAIVRTLNRYEFARLGLALILITVNACNQSSPTETAVTQSSAAIAPSVAPSSSAPSLTAGSQAEIPEGEFLAGSTPGQSGRHPKLEPRSYLVELGAYRIDLLPYPNDPAEPPRTGVSRDEAQRLCAERSARLCTELEWEKACKGPDANLFSNGKKWDPRCKEEPRVCVSQFGVRAQGTLREWTASEIISNSGRQTRAIARGAGAKADESARRCANRQGISPKTQSDDLGFRCCSGPANAAVIREPKPRPTFQKTRITAKRLEKLFAKFPQTSSLASDVQLFREPEAAQTVVSRGPGDRKGFLFTVSPLLWSPVTGSEYLLVGGRSGKNTSFILAYYVVGTDEFHLASTFIMENEVGPVAFAYSDSIRPRLHFSTCWGCLGETGKILYREPDSLIILQP